MKYWKRYLWLALALVAAAVMLWTVNGHIYHTKIERQESYSCQVLVEGCPLQNVKVRIDELNNYRTPTIDVAAVVVALGVIRFTLSFRKTKQK